MIIKATFKDNDHTQHLESFFNGFFTKVLNYLYGRFENTYAEHAEKYKDGFENFQKFQKIFNPNIDQKLSIEDKEFVIKTIKEAIIGYMQTKTNDISYFKDNLDIKIVDHYFEKWENGETLYYFSKCDQYLIN